MFKFANNLPVNTLETISPGFLLDITSNISFSWEMHSPTHKRDEV